ncbi:MAG: GntR family transcriptional regulator [Pseudorhodoplanes sp.]|nr:GntR family transcriptional regulator [Pseudorhodoplanes sp.]MCQ3942716.1 GntR family transcriptional regulator [Alphaproteobacteria bacterium]
MKLKDQIENEIVTGRLHPGERLDEVTLAERFGVSRTPVREALHALAASGLLEVRPHRGAIVAEVSPERLVEMFQVMAELEAMCGRLAARRMTPADLETLRDSHAACALGAEAGDADRYYYDNERFHFSIYEASHNSFLIEQAKALHRRLQPYRRLQLRVRNRLATSYQEHDAILAALVDGDSARAATLLRDHVAVQGERFADLVASLRDLKQGPRNAALAS